MAYFQCRECGYIFSDRAEAFNHWRYDVTGEHETTDDPIVGDHIEELD